jgi:hypothetical protein
MIDVNAASCPALYSATAGLSRVSKNDGIYDMKRGK